ncbi:hypothetical protein IWW38_003276, partial [Coemansia aciculifera]
MLYYTQHNRRFAWGLTACDRTVRAYVYGPDTIWPSTDINVTTAAGRQTFISLLVDWSLCSVDCLGFDPSIRYASDGVSGRPYLEIDIHKKDESTGKVATRTCFSNRCTVAADGLIGRHTRHFAASASIRAMDDPAVLIKDVWLPLNSDNSGMAHNENAILDTLYATFDSDSEFEDKFPQLLSTGPVYLCHGDKFVEDTTARTFAGLPDFHCNALAASASGPQSSLGRQHTHTVVKWAGDTISMADNPSNAVIAIADAMAALTAAHGKCNVVHGNITDRAILFRKTADGGVNGTLTEFGSAIYTGNNASAANRNKPEQMTFRSIRSLENAAAPLTPLDDWESLFYLVCWLGTYGVGDEERAAIAKKVPVNRNIASWRRGSEYYLALAKRNQMSSMDNFGMNILVWMREGPMRDLAIDLYKAL